MTPRCLFGDPATRGPIPAFVMGMRGRHMRAGALLIGLLTLPSRSAGQTPPSGSDEGSAAQVQPLTDTGEPKHQGPTWALYTYPVATTFFALVRPDRHIVYVPLGLVIAHGARTEWVLEASILTGAYLGCGSESTGGWLALGLATFGNDEREGAFILPKLLGRYFNTTGGQTSYWGCGDGDALDGRDYEVHFGLDAGYRWRFQDVLITPMIGVSAGFCGNCLEPGVLFIGKVMSDRSSRADRFSVGLNLNLLRLGVAF